MLAVIVCVGLASVGSEYAQHILSQGKRSFDVWDIACNVGGSLSGIVAAFMVDEYPWRG
ncbi:LADA_0G00694g1_1 [Lachancea dasiensis]|uniref:LADA_0G00694g1_1 n=1 Tax=Lachancea dasiensis TaxID=1072105 RepID=A0A1G4JQE6_9SACH|nr:LADA_0G00694g1_1 [Lachancea dasiensis]